MNQNREELVALATLTRTQFVVQMILCYARIYPGITTTGAMARAAETFRSFLSDEKIEFGDARYAWDSAGAANIVYGYEGIDLPKPLSSRDDGEAKSSDGGGQVAPAKCSVNGARPPDTSCAAEPEVAPGPSEAPSTIPADVRTESGTQYRDAVDRVNRSTDREIAEPDWKQDQAETSRLPRKLTIPADVGPAIENLRNCQTQLDQDGVMVGVSRQALEEVLNAISRLDVPGKTAGEPDCCALTGAIELLRETSADLGLDIVHALGPRGLLKRAAANLSKPAPAAEQGVAVKVKPLEWSAPSEPNASCPYDHVIAESPVGKYLIEWKGWKFDPSYIISLDGEYITGNDSSLEAAKMSAQQNYETRILSALPVAPVVDEAAIRSDEREKLQAEIDRLNGILNTPILEPFAEAAASEAKHQVYRWGEEHDAGKTAWDWFWLLGHLGSKAAHSVLARDWDKAKHHTITAAAMLANWHRQICDAQTIRAGGGER